MTVPLIEMSLCAAHDKNVIFEKDIIDSKVVYRAVEGEEYHINVKFIRPPDDDRFYMLELHVDGKQLNYNYYLDSTYAPSMRPVNARYVGFATDEGAYLNTFKFSRLIMQPSSEASSEAGKIRLEVYECGKAVTDQKFQNMTEEQVPAGAEKDDVKYFENQKLVTSYGSKVAAKRLPQKTSYHRGAQISIVEITYDDHEYVSMRSKAKKRGRNTENAPCQARTGDLALIRRML